MKHLIEELRSHLVDSGLVETPPSTGNLPVCWLAPPQGIPAPGDAEAEGAEVLCGIYPAPGVPLGVMEQKWLAIAAADIYSRGPGHAQPQALELARAIRRLLADLRGFDLGDLRVEQAREVRPAMLIGSDESQGATYVITYEFLVRDESFGQ